MRTRALEFKVGLLIVIAIALLVGFIITLGSFNLGAGYTLYVDFDFSGNIKAGAPVRVSGIKVGKVQEVRFLGGKLDAETGRRVQVRLVVWLEERVRDTLRGDAEFFVNTAGVLGEQYLEIVPGDDYDNPALEPESILVGTNPPRTDLVLSRFYEVLEAVSDVLRDDRELIRDLLKNSASAVGEVDTLLSENRESLGELITRTNRLADEATTTLTSVNAGIGDPQMIARTIRDADALLVNANRSITTLTPPVESLVRDANRVTGSITEARLERALSAVDRVAETAEGASVLLDNTNGMVSDIRKGKGTVGALLVRDEIYADLREMIRDLKRNPWKFFWKE